MKLDKVTRFVGFLYESSKPKNAKRMYMTMALLLLISGLVYLIYGMTAFVPAYGLLAFGITMFFHILWRYEEYIQDDEISHPILRSIVVQLKIIAICIILASVILFGIPNLVYELTGIQIFFLLGYSIAIFLLILMFYRAYTKWKQVDAN